MATRRAPAGRSVRIDAAGAVAGVVALLLAIVVLLRQRDAVGQVAGLDPFLLAIALLVAFVAPWALCVVVNIVGLLAGWLLGVGGFPRPTSP